MSFKVRAIRTHRHLVANEIYEARKSSNADCYDIENGTLVPWTYYVSRFVIVNENESTLICHCDRCKENK